jgi:hypothetical protein
MCLPSSAVSPLYAACRPRSPSSLSSCPLHIYQVRCQGVCSPESSDNRGVGISGGQTSVAKEGSRVSSRVTLVGRICWGIQLGLLGWPRPCPFQVANKWPALGSKPDIRSRWYLHTWANATAVLDQRSGLAAFLFPSESQHLGGRKLFIQVVPWRFSICCRAALFHLSRGVWRVESGLPAAAT